MFEAMVKVEGKLSEKPEQKLVIAHTFCLETVE